MTTERFANFRFDMSANRAAENGMWIPFLEIIEKHSNDDDETVIFPKQRIGLDEVFASESDAIAEARRFAVEHVSSGEF
jgi:hypothetical protein